MSAAPGQPDLLDAIATAGDEDAFYYEVPEAGLALAGLGAECSVEASGADRFEAVGREIRQHGPDDAVWVGGFGFADESHDPAFPAARWWRPRRLWMRRAGKARGGELPPAPRAAPRGRPAQVEHPGPEHGEARYRERVVAALVAIGRGELEKVVVARDLSLDRAAPVDVPTLLRALRALHPRCALYAVKRGETWLVGATPERLLRLGGRELEVVALAGSARRGRDPEEDARLGRRLVESKKEQCEHEVAVRGLREDLEACGAALRVPESPELLRLAGVQHLCTRIRARWERDAPSLFEVAERVHPTAAVCGAPREAARAWLAAHEGLERGWYAGLVGWWMPRGDGELSAALRCARIEGRRARLFAGAGIVAGSDPDSEVRETRLKWNALRPALDAQ